ncbi:chaperone protein dnaJ 11, chloroplastic-like [Pistacia vera]|uniref:chaperone protein dnaJ 11, chloroplastic-like n=1 Tax=Pistacia vera TaxID=55513 RepID=UPI0012636E8E|nr:chaperone protein dnaJ 11, chloroplastic-like [Pistacia vera]
MYATLNIPTIQPHFFSPQSSPKTALSPKSPQSPPQIVLSPNSTRYSGRNKRNPCPSAVSYAAEESTAVGTLGGSLYEVLRVHPTASLTEIKMAYRNLAKVYHPDLSGERTSDGRDFIEIHNAYATLSDPAARAVYDLSLAGRNRRRLQTAPFGFSGRGGFYPTRRWETDQCW